MKRSVFFVRFALFALALAAVPAARAEICTIDQVPAATLLLPYFEVDLSDRSGPTTVFTIHNAFASAAIAHVTLWTDESIPTFNFDVYLTGYDMQTIDLRDIFVDGRLPITADDGVDVFDTVSPQGPLSQDLNFPGSSGPCFELYKDPAIDLFQLTNLQAAHTGQHAPAYGGCLGASYGDKRARGYVTIDLTTQCNLLIATSAAYWSSGIPDTRNVLFGDFAYAVPGEPVHRGSLVAIESCPTPSVGSGGRCPFAPGKPTLYGRYAAVAGQDQREPLPTTFAVRFDRERTAGPVDGTELVVWRDSKTVPTGINGVHACGAANRPAWKALGNADVVAFDEQENAEDLCAARIVSPAGDPKQSCFPLETQRVGLYGGHPIAGDLTPSFDRGWLFLNLNHNLAATVGTDPFPGTAQAWVTTAVRSGDLFELAQDATALDSACTTIRGGRVLIP